jgi:hypothetical protein
VRNMAKGEDNPNTTISFALDPQRGILVPLPTTTEDKDKLLDSLYAAVSLLGGGGKKSETQTNVSIADDIGAYVLGPEGIGISISGDNVPASAPLVEFYKKVGPGYAIGQILRPLFDCWAVWRMTMSGSNSYTASFEKIVNKYSGTEFNSIYYLRTGYFPPEENK